MFRTSDPQQRWVRLAGVMVLTIASMLVAGTATANEGGCYSASVPGRVVLPDGSQHTSVALRICGGRTVSPVSQLQRVHIDGRPVGMFLSVPRFVEASIEGGTAQFIFEGTERGELKLIGYLVATGHRTTLFEMAREESRLVAGSSDADKVDQRNVVMLVARGVGGRDHEHTMREVEPS